MAQNEVSASFQGTPIEPQDQYVYRLRVCQCARNRFGFGFGLGSSQPNRGGLKKRLRLVSIHS